MKVNIYLETDKQCQARVQRRYGYVIEAVYAGRYCAEHPHCVRCAMISHCGSTLPREWDFSELEELRNG